MKKLILLSALACFGVFTVQAQHATTKKKSAHHHKRHHAKANKNVVTHRQHNIKVTEDSGHNPYEGKASRANDGQDHNKQRNMNYQNGTPLPPSDGNNSK
jgi:hypothetical protein